MDNETAKRIQELKEKISQLPKGYISTKRIRGNEYCYQQWNENGKKISRYIKDDDVFELRLLIHYRQELEAEIRILKKGNNIDSFIWCTLMHKRIPVVDIYLDKNTGHIIHVGALLNASHLPVGTISKDDMVNEKALKEWWIDRSIPFSRSGVKEALEKLNIKSPPVLLLYCYGLSLSDQYWIVPTGGIIDWEEINFFDHDFSDDVGEVLLGGKKKSDTLNLSSPDNTSVGNLKKRWKISEGKRILIKGGSNPFRQEPYNEAVASLIAKELGIPCVNYSLFYDKDYPYSECEDFIDKNQDLITAYQANKVLVKNNSDSSYTHLLKCCDKLGIKGVEEYLNKLLVFDFIIANEDRHFNNFGFIRNADDLSFVGPSVVFDSGSSFGFDKITADILPFKNIESKPFRSEPLEQLKLVTSFKWLEISALERIKEIVKNEFNKFESKYLDKARIDAIVTSTHKRIDYLIGLIRSK